MPVSTERNIRELIAEKPEAARILMNHQIDFCENSRRTLDEVCRERRMSATVIGEEVVSAASRRPLSGLLDHVVATHHGFLRAELPWAETMVRRVNQKHGEKYPFLEELELAVVALREELEAHLMKEERILFPYIAALERASAGGDRPDPGCFGTVENPIRMMEFEHETAQEALRVFRHLTSDYTPPPDSCLSFSILYRSLASLDADLQVHIALENNVIHPAARELERRLMA